MTAARLMLLCAAVAAAIGCGAPIGLESFDQHPVVASQFHDAKRATIAVTSQVGYPYQKREAFARLVFTSNTRSVSIDAVNDLLAVPSSDSPGGFNSLGLLVDGVQVSGGCQLGKGTGDLGHLQRCTLSGWSSGSHTFEVWDGPAVLLAGGIRRGSPAQVIYTDRGSTWSVTTPTAPAKRILVIADSMAGGAHVTTAGHASAYDAWPMQMRQNAAASGGGTWAGARVINDQIGGYTMGNAANDATEAAALTAQCDGTSSTLVIVALGVNDYQTAVSGATFQADTATLLDLIHTQCASASVLTFTPVNKLSEVANGAGRTLGAYRTDETNACNARSSYCTVLSGVGILNTATDLSADGLHPNTGGHAKIEAAVRAAIGYDLTAANDNAMTWAQVFALPRRDERRRRRRPSDRVRRAA